MSENAKENNQANENTIGATESRLLQAMSVADETETSPQ